MEPQLPEMSPPLSKNVNYRTGEPSLDRQLEQLHSEVRSLRSVVNDLIRYIQSRETDQ